MNSHHDPEHPRFCTPQTFRSIYSFRRNRPARTTRKQSLSFAPPPVSHRVIAVKHAATMARRNAFLDLNAAVEREDENAETYLNRYRDAVMMQRMVKAA